MGEPSTLVPRGFMLVLAFVSAVSLATLVEADSRATVSWILFVSLLVTTFVEEDLGDMFSLKVVSISTLLDMVYGE